MLRAAAKSLLPVAAALIFAAAAPAASAPQAAAVAVTLKDSVTVSSSELTVADVASVTGASAALAAKVAAVPAGKAPWPGQTLTLDGANISMRLKLARIDTSQVAITGSRCVRISRASQRISGSAIAQRAVEAVTASWSGEGRIECEPTRTPADVVAGAGKVELNCQPGQVRSGVYSVPVTIDVEGAPQRSTSVTLKVRVYRDALVTTRAIARGQQITEADVAVQEREMVSGYAAASQPEMPSIQGTKAARDLPSGALLKNSDLEVIPLVRRNAPVVLVTSSGGVTVRATAVAAEDGLLGQIVKVRPDHTTQTVSARVAGDGRVEIGL